MASRKEIRWSQLRVGAVILVSMAILVGLIMLMSGSAGGLFARTLTLRSYFQNAEGLKNGAPVTLEGVTIGNVTSIRVVPGRSQSPVEVTVRVGERYREFLHTDSTTVIAQAGVLGDSYVDLSSRDATGPNPPNNAELPARSTPGIQQVVNTSQDVLQKVSTVMVKLSTTLDAINSKKGSIGLLFNDPSLYTRLAKVAGNLETVSQGLAEGKGSMGKLLTDESVYNKLNASVTRLDAITQALNSGQGTAGKLLKDDALYNNLNAAVANTNKLVEGINQGKGGLGKLAADPAFAQKLDDAVTNLDDLLAGINQGKGSLGQLAQNRALYDHLDQTTDQAQQLLQEIRKDPKKYFVIRLKLF